jgi:hypothetical protein
VWRGRGSPAITRFPSGSVGTCDFLLNAYLRAYLIPKRYAFGGVFGDFPLEKSSIIDLKETDCNTLQKRHSCFL